MLGPDIRDPDSLWFYMLTPKWVQTMRANSREMKEIRMFNRWLRKYQRRNSFSDLTRLKFACVDI